MKKIILMIVALLTVTLCGCTKTVEDSFSKFVEESESYVCEGVMESFFDNGKKENNFMVYYKKPDLLKVVFSENDNKQVVLKNTDGVFILIPAVNKNFKIDSSWPNNASYPYLLDSIKKDIEKEDVEKTETDTSYSITTTSKMFNDSVETKEKITFDKKTNLPVEVIVYDQHDEVYIRVTFTNITLNKELNDDEFKIEPVMKYLRKDELTVFEKREFLLPTYVPEGYSTSKENTLISGSGDELTSIMKFTGENSFTIIQEYVNDSEVLQTVMSSGEVLMILGNVGIFRGESVEVYSDGVMYTLASENLDSSEIIKIISSYFVNPEK